MLARPHRGNRGFTLVELVAVVAIIAILAAYGAPRFIGNSTFAERGFADELASTLRLARSVAVATSCDVQFSINAGTYQVMQRAAGAPGAPCQTAGAFVTPVERTDGTTLSGYPRSGLSVPGNVAFTFDRKGTVAGGAPPALTVGAFTVSVDADGWVQVQ